MYGKQLVEEGSCTKEALEEIKAMVNRTLEAEFQAAKTWVTPKHDWLSSKVAVEIVFRDYYRSKLFL